MSYLPADAVLSAFSFLRRSYRQRAAIFLQSLDLPGKSLDKSEMAMDHEHYDDDVVVDLKYLAEAGRKVALRLLSDTGTIDSWEDSMELTAKTKKSVSLSLTEEEEAQRRNSVGEAVAALAALRLAPTLTSNSSLVSPSSSASSASPGVDSSKGIVATSTDYRLEAVDRLRCALRLIPPSLLPSEATMVTAAIAAAEANLRPYYCEEDAVCQTCGTILLPGFSCSVRSRSVGRGPTRRRRASRVKARRLRKDEEESRQRQHRRGGLGGGGGGGGGRTFASPSLSGGATPSSLILAAASPALARVVMGGGDAGNDSGWCRKMGHAEIATLSALRSYRLFCRSAFRRTLDGTRGTRVLYVCRQCGESKAFQGIDKAAVRTRRKRVEVEEEEKEEERNKKGKIGSKAWDGVGEKKRRDTDGKKVVTASKMSMISTPISKKKGKKKKTTNGKECDSNPKGRSSTCASRIMGASPATLYRESGRTTLLDSGRKRKKKKTLDDERRGSELMDFLTRLND